MQKINKSFGANRVLRDVDFSLGTGEICALLGENGAGKSTLMNILGGVLPADSGTICWTEGSTFDQRLWNRWTPAWDSSTRS